MCMSTKREQAASPTKISSVKPPLLLPLLLFWPNSLASRNGFLDMVPAGCGGDARRGWLLLGGGKVALCGDGDGDGDVARLRKGLLEERRVKRLGDGCRSAGKRGTFLLALACWNDRRI